MDKKKVLQQYQSKVFNPFTLFRVFLKLSIHSQIIDLIRLINGTLIQNTASLNSIPMELNQPDPAFISDRI